MKKIIILLLIFAACKSTKDPVLTVEVCTFGIDTTQLKIDSTKGADSMTARIDSLTTLAKGKPPKPDPVPPINPDNPANRPVFYIDFDGGSVSGLWGNFTCLPAGLDSVGMRLVVENVIEDFAPWFVTVTTSEAVFNAAPVSKRHKLIVTASTPLGVTTGQSFLNSFGTGNPSFVFTTYTVTRKKAKEVASHELGHSLGLRHQDNCDGTYANGKIMGNGFYVEFPVWTKTPCQDDMRVIDKKLQRR